MTINVLLTEILPVQFSFHVKQATQHMETIMEYDFESRFSISLAWSLSDWAFASCDAFSDFGIGTLVVGPVQIQLTWPSRLRGGRQRLKDLIARELQVRRLFNGSSGS